MPTFLRENSVLGRETWVLFPLCCAVTLGVVLGTGFSLVWSSLLTLLLPAVGIAAVFGGYAKYRPDPVIVAMTEALLFLFLIGAPLAILVYPLQSLGFPLRDAEFAAIDQAMGFDWMAHFAWISAHPAAGKLLSLSYHSCMAQMGVGVIILSLTKRFGHLREFLFLFTATALVVSIIAAFVPALGAFPFHAPPATMKIGNDPLVCIYHLEDVLALRSGTLRTVDMAHINGLVTLPSFHAIFAILLAWSTRGLRSLFIPSMILNTIVCISAIAIGGHYLIDIITGAAIAFAAIYIYQTSSALAHWLDGASQLTQNMGNGRPAPSQASAKSGMCS